MGFFVGHGLVVMAAATRGCGAGSGVYIARGAAGFKELEVE
jgi:hypothetical protein